MPDDDEAPTKPDGNMFACPACMDGDGRPTGKEIKTQRTCRWCKGSGIIDRVVLQTYRHEQKHGSK